MNEIEKQLTNPNFISDELSGFITRGEEFVLSIMERHSHGESFSTEEDTAKAIIAKVRKVRDNDPEKQLIETALSLENLLQSIPLLVAENNKRLLNIIPRISP